MSDSTIEELRWWSNTVRPYKGAACLGSETGQVRFGRMTVELHKGRASQGYKTDYERIESWWVSVQIVHAGRRYVRGTRYSGRSAERKARKEFADAAASLREYAA